MSIPLALIAVTKAIYLLFHRQILILRLRLCRNHIIVCGLDSLGKELIKRFGYSQNTKLPNRLVAVHSSPQQEEIEILDVPRTLLADGFATSPTVLRQAGIARAARIILASMSDETNLRILSEVISVADRQIETPLQCHVHITSPQTLKLCRQSLSHATNRNIQCSFFNMSDALSIAMITMLPPTVEFEFCNKGKPSIVIVGANDKGLNLLSLLARWWAIPYRSFGKLPVIIIDPEATANVGCASAMYPWIPQFLLLEIHDIPINSAEFIQGTHWTAVTHELQCNAAYICCDDDSLALLAKDRLRRQFPTARILVQFKSEQLRNLVAITEDPAIDAAICPVQEACQPNLVLDSEVELLSRVIHMCYVLRTIAKDPSKFGLGAVVNWHLLDEDRKEQNRSQARDIPQKLELLNLSFAPLGSNSEITFFSLDEVEYLAEMEHERWHKLAHQLGWRYGKTKDEHAKLSPWLISYAELPEEIKDNDRNAVREIPEYLAAAGYVIFKRIPTAQTEASTEPQVVARGTAFFS